MYLVNEDIKSEKKKFADDHFLHILRQFDFLPNFFFTTNETMWDYYLQTWYVEVTSQVAIKC